MRINNQNEIYNILPEELRNEYTIGIHGFNGTHRYWTMNEDGTYYADETKIQTAKDSILSEGLKYPKSRALLSTIRFTELSSYISSNDTWLAGGVLVALPKVLRDEKGEEIFVGGPDEKGRIALQCGWDRNTQPTSLSEILLPEAGCLNPMFIIGTYSRNEGGDGIDVKLNSNHIAFNKGIVPDSYFEEKKVQYSDIILDREIQRTIIPEVKRQKREYQTKKIVSLTSLGKKSYKHFGSKIGERLGELLYKFKSQFFGKDFSQNGKDETEEQK